MTKLKAGSVDEFKESEAKIIVLNGVEIGIIRLGERFFAMRNSCPHRLAPICKGKITGTMLPSSPGELIYGMDGKLIRCPWHGYDYDIETGKCLFNGTNLKVKTYETSTLDGEVFVTF
jgi:nitrite reductase (NADH) small subunit